MIRWFRDLISLFRRPLDGGPPNYGYVPARVMVPDKLFCDSDEQSKYRDEIARQMKIAQEIMDREHRMLRALGGDDYFSNDHGC